MDQNLAKLVISTLACNFNVEIRVLWNGDLFVILVLIINLSSKSAPLKKDTYATTKFYFEFVEKKHYFRSHGVKILFNSESAPLN